MKPKNQKDVVEGTEKVKIRAGPHEKGKKQTSMLRKDKTKQRRSTERRTQGGAKITHNRNDRSKKATATTRGILFTEEVGAQRREQNNVFLCGAGVRGGQIRSKI